MMIVARQNPIRTWFDYVRLRHPFPTKIPHQNPYGWFIGLVYFLVFAGSLLVLTYLLAFINPVLIAVDQTIFYELSFRNPPSYIALSSLFFDLSRWVLATPMRPYYWHAALLSSSFFITGVSLTFLLATYRISKTGILLLLGCLFALGGWWHITYTFWNDIPLSAISFSLAIGAFVVAIVKPQPIRWWLIHFLLIGFATSWKTYNVFGSMVILAFSIPLFWQSRNHHPSRFIPMAIGMLLLGYLAGMYHLFTDPVATIHGILGYPMAFSWKRLAACVIPLPSFSRGILDHTVSTALTVGSIPFPLLLSWIWVSKEYLRPFWVGLMGIGSLFSIYILKFGIGINRHATPLSWGLLFSFAMMLIALHHHPQFDTFRHRAMDRLKMGVLGALLITFCYVNPTQIIINWGINRAVTRLNENANLIHTIIHPYQVQYPTLSTYVWLYRWRPHPTTPVIHPDFTYRRITPLQEHDPRFMFVKESLLFHKPTHHTDPIIMVVPSYQTPLLYFLASPFWKFYENKYTSEMIGQRKKNVIFKNNAIRIVLYLPETTQP